MQTSAVSSIATHDQARAPQARSLVARILRDLVGVVLLAVAALLVGLAMNRFSAAPLSIVYQTPEQRFDAELTTLISAPPFKIAPAATIGLDKFRAAVDSK